MRHFVHWSCGRHPGPTLVSLYGTISVRAELSCSSGGGRGATERARLYHSLKPWIRPGKLDGRGREVGRMEGRGSIRRRFRKTPHTRPRQGDRRWSEGGGRRHMKERGRRQGVKRKHRGEWKTARDGRSLYLEKAAGRPRRRALPKPATPTLIGRPLAWKPESAPLWPSARL